MKVLAANRPALFRYELLEKFAAGIELLGFEVKAVRAGRLNLAGARVVVLGGEVYLVNAGLAPYQPANTPADYDPRRPRRLLLAKKEISRLAAATVGSRLTIIPVAAYTKGPRIKVEIALARGRKKYDKRETIKRRDTEREIRRRLKDR